MTPNQVKNQIDHEYRVMLDRARHGEINEGCIYRIIESLARSGARHNGQPQLWKTYMPEELMQWLKS